jgi:hypothetical protein
MEEIAQYFEKRFFINTSYIALSKLYATYRTHEIVRILAPSESASAKLGERHTIVYKGVRGQ